MCVKRLISRKHTKRHLNNLARENLYLCVAINCGKASKLQQKIIVLKGKAKLVNLKDNNNFKLKVKKSKKIFKH